MQQPPPIERSSASLHPARPPAQPLAFRLLLTSSRDAKEYRGLYKRIILDKYSLLLNDEEEEYITRGLGKIAAKRKGRKEGKHICVAGKTKNTTLVYILSLCLACSYLKVEDKRPVAAPVARVREKK
jgi:hypothetical protein